MNFLDYLNDDVLKDRYGKTEAVEMAKKLLEQDDQTEEGFLGAQTIFLLNGLI